MKLRITGLRGRGLYNRVAAELPSPAPLAAESGPDAVEVVHRRLHELGAVRQDAGLEVAARSPLHPDSRAGEIGGADVGEYPVEHQNLKVHPRAERPLEAGRQDRIPVELIAEDGPWLLGVDESY